MKRVLLPTFCFAVLSTVAFEEEVFATQTETVVSEKAFKTTAKYVNISSGFLNLRESTSTSAKVLATLIKGTEVTVYSETNGWSKVKANGKEGYVSSSYLTSTKPGTSKTSPPSAPPAPEPKMGKKYVKVNSGSLNVRKSASTSASIVTTIKKDEEVTVYSEANGWSKIKANGKEGYVSSSYLTSTKPGTSKTSPPSSPPAPEPKTETKYVKVNSGSLNVRKSASTSASIVTTIKKDAEVTVYSETNGWSKIKANGKEGYVSSSYLTSTKPGTSDALPSPPPPEPETKYVNVSSGSLNMRNSASSTASIIVKLAKGKAVKVYSESNGWAKIEAFGQIGYVSSQYLTTLKPSENNSSIPEVTTTKYVNVSSSLNVRETDSLSGKVLTTLTKGTEVTVLSESNGWAKIAVNGQVGYVSAPYLSETKPIAGSSPEPEQAMENKYVNISIGSSLNMRNHPSADSSIIVKLARGTEVTVYSEEDGWAKIKAYEQMGYVSSDYLSSTKPTAGTESSLENSPDQSNENNTDEIISKYVNVIYGSTLNMRTEPTTSATIMTKLSRGTVVTVYSEENDWARITANGQTGYVSSRYLSITEPYNPSTSDKNEEKTFEQYPISLKDLTDIQMAIKPQTDKKYQTYIREDALVLTGSSSGTVKGTSWNIRGGAGTNYWVVGTVKNGTNLPIISKIMGNDGYYWYQIDYNKSWVNASPEDVSYYLDSTNFLSTTVDSLQFLKLSVSANLNVGEVNERILAGKGILAGTASAFVAAGEMYNVNEVYLIAHALLETGKGTSQLATGVNVNGKTVYNMYGIGAYDGTALASGAQHAYNAGWFTPEAAIIGGAKFIAQGYIGAGQDTLYKMRWNPSSAVMNGYASHQYATDIGWAAKQVNQIHNLYNLIDSYTLVLDIPTYQ